MYWHSMIGYGPVHWLAMLVALVVVLYPVGRILARLGFPPLLAILAVIPLANLVALWVLAFIEWPKRGGSGAPSA
jgi:hypothetical protein